MSAPPGSSTNNYGTDPLPVKGITNVFKSPTSLNENGDLGDFYHPWQLQNSRFKIPTQDSEWWKGENDELDENGSIPEELRDELNGHRILYSVLEYYVPDEDPLLSLPRFIIRVRFLKLPEDVKKEKTEAGWADLKMKDPWFMGPEFFLSEPMWFGEFVGSPALSNTVDVRNYNDVFQSSVNSGTVGLTSDRVYYALEEKISIKKIKSIFKSKRMSIYHDAVETIPNKNDKDKVSATLSNSKRDRYLGIQVYSDKQTLIGDDRLTIYDINLVPGFTADEIRSILPLNGKLYKVDDTTTRKPTNEQWYTQKPALKNYNDMLFGTNGYSNGSGNNGSRYYPTAPGILGLQHVPSSCSCPLENELFKWLDK